MKRFLFYLIPCILLASCGSKYSNKVDSQGIAQTCNYTTLTDSVKTLSAEGFVSVSPVPGGTYEVCDSVYTVSMTWKQAWQYEVQHGYTWMFWFGLIIIAGGIGSFIYLTARGENSLGLVLIPMAAILIGGALVGESAEWAKWNTSRQIKKIDYVNSYSQSDSAKDAFWAAPAKAY